MSTAQMMTLQDFQSKFPAYAPPTPREKEGMLSVIEAAHELQLRLDRCPSWDRGWQGLNIHTRQRVLAMARIPSAWGGWTTCWREGWRAPPLWVKASDKAWGAAHPEYAVWWQQRARGAEAVAARTRAHQQSHHL